MCIRDRLHIEFFYMLSDHEDISPKEHASDILPDSSKLLPCDKLWNEAIIKNIVRNEKPASIGYLSFMTTSDLHDIPVHFHDLLKKGRLRLLNIFLIKKCSTHHTSMTIPQDKRDKATISLYSIPDG